MSDTQWVRPVEPTEDQRAAVLRLAAAAAAQDGIDPLGEHVLLALAGAGQAQHVLAQQGGELVGYAQIDPAGPSAELVVHPEHRRRGIGTELVAQAGRDHPRLRVWAHGSHPGALALAGRLGWTPTRRLLIMKLVVPEVLPPVRLPDGVALRTFLPGLDETEWLALNSRAFTELPDQGGWTRSDLDQRTAQPWFDPSGLLIAVDSTAAMVGFHWTKIHERPTASGHEHVGEVYVVGVDPSQRGRGLGRALTLAGLHHLARAGLGTVILYVDAANPGAVALYTSLGFGLQHADTELTAPMC